MFKIFYIFTRIFLKDHTDFQFNYFQIMQTVLRKIFKSSNKSFYLRGMTSSNCLNNRLVRKKAFPTHTYTKEHNFIFNLTHTYIQADIYTYVVYYFLYLTDINFAVVEGLANLCCKVAEERNEETYGGECGERNGWCLKFVIVVEGHQW